MSDELKPQPSAYIQERPTSSDSQLLYKHVTFFPDGKPGETPLYTLEQAAEIFGISLSDIAHLFK